MAIHLLYKIFLFDLSIFWLFTKDFKISSFNENVFIM